MPGYAKACRHLCLSKSDQFAKNSYWHGFPLNILVERWFMLMPANCIMQTCESRYSIAGNFRGVQFSQFSQLIGKPRKLNPQNKVLTCGVWPLWFACCSIDYFASVRCCWTSTGMSLLRYFKASSDTTKLHDPRGPVYDSAIVVHRIS